MPRLAPGSLLRTGCMWLAIAAGSVSVWADAAQPGPSLLERVQAFAERYQREAPSLVVEEHYLQKDLVGRAKGDAVALRLLRGPKPRLHPPVYFSLASFIRSAIFCAIG
jgi:hypothetical protein